MPLDKPSKILTCLLHPDTFLTASSTSTTPMVMVLSHLKKLLKPLNNLLNFFPTTLKEEDSTCLAKSLLNLANCTARMSEPPSKINLPLPLSTSNSSKPFLRKTNLDLTKESQEKISAEPWL